jgi:DUF4097 and DUF4098 domain-containing protein YvlB
MTSQRHDEGHDHDDLGRGGFSGFLRSLLAGIPWSEYAEALEELHIDAHDSTRLRLRNAIGRTRVRGEDRSDIEVIVSKSARAETTEAADRLLEQIRLKRRGHDGTIELEVEIPRRWNRRGCANLEIRLPRDMKLELESVNGRIEISGLRSRVRARSSNGSASICDVVGDIEIMTSNAKVCCSGTCGNLIARSSNGKIEIDAHRGSIDASTSNGLIRASIEELGENGVQLATSNGRIVLELPDEVDADVDIRIDNGIIRNDRTLDSANRETTGRLSGRLGRGGVPIKVRTSNGSISLR